MFSVFAYDSLLPAQRARILRYYFFPRFVLHYLHHQQENAVSRGGLKVTANGFFNGGLIAWGGEAQADVRSESASPGSVGKFVLLRQEIVRVARAYSTLAVGGFPVEVSAGLGLHTMDEQSQLEEKRGRQTLAGGGEAGRGPRAYGGKGVVGGGKGKTKGEVLVPGKGVAGGKSTASVFPPEHEHADQASASATVVFCIALNSNGQLDHWETKRTSEKAEPPRGHHARHGSHGPHQGRKNYCNKVFGREMFSPTGGRHLAKVVPSGLLGPAPPRSNPNGSSQRGGEDTITTLHALSLSDSEPEELSSSEQVLLGRGPTSARSSDGSSSSSSGASSRGGDEDRNAVVSSDGKSRFDAGPAPGPGVLELLGVAVGAHDTRTGQATGTRGGRLGPCPSSAQLSRASQKILNDVSKSLSCMQAGIAEDPAVMFVQGGTPIVVQGRGLSAGEMASTSESSDYEHIGKGEFRSRNAFRSPRMTPAVCAARNHCDLLQSLSRDCPAAQTSVAVLQE